MKIIKKNNNTENNTQSKNGGRNIKSKNNPQKEKI